MQRLLIIGLDGGTWDLVEPWAEAGYLPHIKDLMEASAWGVLRAPLQPITAPSWVTFMTGVNQGKHGVYDFVRRRPGEYNLDVANATFIRHPTFFDELGNRGRSVCLLNLPFSFPPHPVNGYMVSGLFAPAVGPEICYPRGLWSEILKVAPDYIVQPDFDEWAMDPLADFASALRQAVRARTEAAYHLLSQDRWDLFVVVYTATDVASHAYWRHMQEAPETQYGRVIRDVYSLADEGIGSLLELIDDDTSVVLMSDHGSGPLHRFVQLNKWLADHGWLRFETTTLEAGWWKAQLRESIKRAARAYRRYLPASARRWFRQKMRTRFELAKARMESLLFATAIDWSRTGVYSLGACGNIFLNVKGREPRGTVPPGDAYQQLREEVRQQLLGLRDPETGKRLVAFVHNREELYEGPYAEEGPDLVVEWQDYRYWGRGRYDVQTDKVFEEPRVWDFSGQPLVATHRLEGILSVKAPHVRPGRYGQAVRMVDMAPLAFYLLGESVPADLDGAVPGHLFLAPPEVCVQDRELQPQRDLSAYDGEDLLEITERLEGLGYL